jgi:hypothetical protein
VDTLAKVHDAVTVVFGSMADASGIALAFHVDSWVTIALLCAVGTHIVVGVVLWGGRHRAHSRERKRMRARVVGFQPPVIRS